MKNEKNTGLLFRKIRMDEIDLLSQLAVRSKAYWGYSSEFMESCKNELQVKKSNVESENFSYWVAEKRGELLGFYALERLSKLDFKPESKSKTEFELEALFVEPDHIGSGIGGALLTHAIDESKKLGGTDLTIQSDPNAENFYLSSGAVLIGTRESQSIPGRYLPTFYISLLEP